MAESDAHKPPAPPYIAFQSLKTLLGVLKEHGLPGRIDRSMLGNFSGSVGSQLITALRFLRLIDPNGVPTQALSDLVTGYGTDRWDTELLEVLKVAYDPMFSFDLATATSSQFNDVFRRAYPSAEGETARKCMTFFLNAAREANVSISGYIMQNKKPRTAPARRKPLKAKPKADGVPDAHKWREQDDPPPPRLPETGEKAKTPEQTLLDILDPGRMTAEEQKAVFTLLIYLKKPVKASKQSGGHQG
jgi:hypothetical protein